LGDNLEITYCRAAGEEWFELTRFGDFDCLCFEPAQARALMDYLAKQLRKKP
jgi:hypothetical protein